MKIEFKTTNHVSETCPELTEQVCVGFINNGSFAMLNQCNFDFDSLTPDQQIIATQFIDIIKTKMLTCDSDGDGIPDRDDS